MPNESENKTQIDAFWVWFVQNSERLRPNGNEPEVVSILDQKLRVINERLSWEIGPGKQKPWQFVVSPNLDKGLLAKTQEMVAVAPELPDWEFYPTRQPKEWDYRVELNSDDPNQIIEIDASSWEFVLLRYPDGLREVLLYSGNLPTLNKNDRWQAAAIVLESLIGEESMMTKIDEFDLVSDLEPRFSERKRPITMLREAVDS